MTLKEKTIRANYLFNKARYEDALSTYQEIVQVNPILERVFSFNINLCKKNVEKISLGSSVINSFDRDQANRVFDHNIDSFDASRMNPVDEIFITMTTIDSRIEKVKFVMESLAKQTYQPAKIFLNISKEPYLLDKGLDENNATLQEIQSYKNVVINWVPNIGPYRKIYPFLERHFSQTVSKEKIFITVDDDTLYPDYFVAELYKKYRETNSIIAFRGRCIEIEEGRLSKYDNWSLGKNLLSFGNLPTGKDGIIYSTNFFTREFLNLEVIKEIAPTVDDLWIKWHCALNGVKSQILNPEACTSDYKSFPVVDFSNEYRGNSLYAMLNSKKAGGNNDIAIEKLENYFAREYGYNLKFMLDQESRESHASSI